MRLTLGWVAQATRGDLRAGDADGEVGNIVIDSRIVQPGDLFVALRGPRFDGHDFVGEVLKNGAVAAVVERKADLKVGLYDTGSRGGGEAGSRRGGPLGPPTLIEVDDTLQALQDLARAVRIESRARVIAITGSAGKTTT